MLWSGWMRRLVLRTQPMIKQPNDNPSKSNKVNLIKMSADVHKRDFKISRQIGDQNIQPAQVFKPEEAFEWALKQRELAMARLIGVDLWRLYTGQTTVDQLGLRTGPEGREYALKAL